jgi:hypothetical protein
MHISFPTAKIGKIPQRFRWIVRELRASFATFEMGSSDGDLVLQFGDPLVCAKNCFALFPHSGQTLC